MFAKSVKSAVPITLVPAKEYKAWLKKQSAPTRKWVELRLADDAPKAGQSVLIADNAGGVDRVIAFVADTPAVFDIAGLPTGLPALTYTLDNSFAKLKDESLFLLCLGWGLGSYRFTRYKAAKKKLAQLVLPKGIDARKLNANIEAQTFARDIINLSPADMQPNDLAAAARKTAAQIKGKISIVKGDALLSKKSHFPLVHAVGRAAEQPPHVIDIRWGNAKHPKVTLVGKGVCFDTGGLSIKPSRYMPGMKMDMTGAAITLALARLVAAYKLPIRLRVLIPAVENSVSDESVRPDEVVKSRKGLTVEVTDTDAEGRLILADCLAAASEDKPDYIFDFATLTGTRAYALGAETSALLCTNDAMAEALYKAGVAMKDPCWRLPLIDEDESQLDSTVADVHNVSSWKHDTIMAAMFLRRFINKGQKWAHFDVAGENKKAKPGRPEGGETSAMRLVFSWLLAEFGGKTRFY